MTCFRDRKDKSVWGCSLPRMERSQFCFVTQRNAPPYCGWEERFVTRHRTAARETNGGEVINLFVPRRKGREDIQAQKH